MTPICIGIDPGHSGAISRNEDGNVVQLYPMPVVLGEKRSNYDIVQIKRLLEIIPIPCHAFIERQQPLPPKMGGSLASYWRGAGQYLFEGLLCGLEIPYEVVPPQTWQKEFFAGLSKDLGKQRSVIVCKRLFPGVDLKRTPKCRKDDDGIADAILIAEWGRRHLGLSVSGEK